jgi:lipopolysaccharide heptosyltransferase I
VSTTDKNRHIERILIIRLSAIGDVVRTLPALSSLRREYPEAHIAWAVEDKAGGILEGHPHLDEIIEFKRKEIVAALKNPLRLLQGVSMILGFLEKIRAGGFDVVFDFHGILKSGVFAAWSGSPRRIGFEREFVKEFNYLFTNEKLAPSDAMLPRVERNLEMIRQFVSPENIIDRPTLGLSEVHRENARAFVAEKFDGTRRLVAMHPGTSRDIKKWPVRHFAELCDMLSSSLGADVMITWGPGEREEAEAISSLAKSGPVIGAHTTSVLELAALLEACDLMVTVDSGPMHIGSAVGTPVVAIFGPTDVKVNAPHWSPTKIVTSDIHCRPCDEDCDDAKCMESATPRMVFDAVRDLLERPGNSF